MGEECGTDGAVHRYRGALIIVAKRKRPLGRTRDRFESKIPLEPKEIS